MRRVNRGRLFFSVTFFIGFTLAYFSGEGLVRLFSPRLFDLSNPLFRFDPELGWVYRSGVIGPRRNEAGATVVVAGDALGLRQPPHPFDANSHPVVLVVGDSLTAGTQVAIEEAWPARLEGRLKGSHPSLEVVNAGVDGYDLAQEFRLAQRVWPRFKPRVLVVGLYVGNDIVDYETQSQAPPPWAWGGPLRAVMDHSFLFQFFSGSARVIERRTRRHRVAPPLPDWDPRSLPGHEDLSPLEQERVRGQFASPELLPVMRDGADGRKRIATTERVLSALSLLAASHNARALIVLIPTKQQVLPAERREWMRLFHLSEEDVHVPEQRLASWAQREGIALVDPLPALEARPAPESLFWRVDLHLSGEGHSALAEAVEPALTALATGESAVPLEEPLALASR